MQNEMSDFIGKKITTANLIALVKAGFLGVLVSESYYISSVISLKLNGYISNGNYGYEALILGLGGFFLVLAYLISRGFLKFAWRIIKSSRFDIFIAFFFGVLVSISFGGIGVVVYTDIVSFFTIKQILIFISFPVVIWFLFLFRTVQIWFMGRKKKISPFFINDEEQKFKKDDMLNFSERAERFAERVLNRGSLDSMVFGIDAPWGIGKSTFVNFCEEYWDNGYHEKVILYKFNPLRYEGRVNLLEKFVDGLIRVIQENSFAPEIKPLISNYSRFIKGTKTTFLFPWLNFEIFWGTYTIDDAFNDLETTLSNFNKKIIVVVDDLDRMNFSEIKDILFVIKKSFTLPNISYVLCYDTENISALEEKKHDSEKIIEFLEKFVNVKISLFLDNQVLSDYVSKNLEKVLESNLQIDPLVVERMRQVMGGIVEIYKSPDFHEYLPFLGDIRKLKRLINTLLLFEIEKADFENSDFNKQDLIHLLLIYISYPNIFRKIYNTETNGRRGFFSVVIPHEDNYPEGPNGKVQNSTQDVYKNSKLYNKYIESPKLNENQKFLLNKVFNVSQRLEDPTIDRVSQEIKHSYACFNGVWTDGRNLEEYLNLIVKLSKPQRGNQYRFYLNIKNEILKGKGIQEILLKHDEFLYSKSENSHEQLWRIVINSLHEFDSQVGSKLITYILNNIQNYSVFTNKNIGVGLRDDVDFFLVKLLDTVGWSDQNGRHRNNTEEHIAEIAEWIFGEENHIGNGVLETLSKEDRGVLGLYDLLAFRLFCSADRGGDIFNLERSLSKHGNPQAPTEEPIKNTVIEEMREISQKVFQIFKSQYINKDKNIFDIVDNLSLADLTGKYRTFVEEKVASGEVKDIDTSIRAFKSRIKSFTTYQLGNSLISLGIGCGYYDPTGKEDKNEIKRKINAYLFNVCFNPKKNSKNYEHFVDYLLMNFASVFASEAGRDYIPDINEFTKVLNRRILADYWKKNAEAVKALNLPTQNKIVVTPNYTVSYKKDLAEVYEVLDRLVQEVEKKAKAVSKLGQILKQIKEQKNK